MIWTGNFSVIGCVIGGHCFLFSVGLDSDISHGTESQRLCQVSQRPESLCGDSGLLETGLDEKELAVRVLYRLGELSKNPPGGEASKN